MSCCCLVQMHRKTLVVLSDMTHRMICTACHSDSECKRCCSTTGPSKSHTALRSSDNHEGTSVPQLRVARAHQCSTRSSTNVAAHTAIMGRTSVDVKGSLARATWRAYMSGHAPRHCLPLTTCLNTRQALHLHSCRAGLHENLCVQSGSAWLWLRSSLKPQDP